jgi:hypothetical protein
MASLRKVLSELAATFSAANTNVTNNVTTKQGSVSGTSNYSPQQIVAAIRQALVGYLGLQTLGQLPGNYNITDAGPNQYYVKGQNINLIATMNGAQVTFQKVAPVQQQAPRPILPPAQYQQQQQQQPAPQQ